MGNSDDWRLQCRCTAATTGDCSADGQQRRLETAVQMHNSDDWRLQCRCGNRTDLETAVLMHDSDDW